MTGTIPKKSKKMESFFSRSEGSVHQWPLLVFSFFYNCFSNYILYGTDLQKWKFKLLRNRVETMGDDKNSIGNLSALPRHIIMQQILKSKAQLLLY